MAASPVIYSMPSLPWNQYLPDNRFTSYSQKFLDIRDTDTPTRGKAYKVINHPIKIMLVTQYSGRLGQCQPNVLARLVSTCFGEFKVP